MSAAVFGITFAIYTLSLAPGVFGWDSAELTLGIYAQGIVHATGYPLYLIVGRLFTLLPLSAEFAVRANLFSALTGALTAGVLYRVCLRAANHRLAAAGSALAFAFAQEIWTQAVVAEVYMLHTLLMAGVLLLLMHWLDHPTHRRLYAIFLCFGLAFANHMASLLVAVVLMPYLLARTPGWRERVAALAITAATTALLYLYLPIRYAAQPEFNLIARYFERDLRAPGEIAWMVSGQMFGGEMFAYALLDWVGEMRRFAVELFQNFLGVGLVIGALGVVWLWREKRTLCALLLAVFAAQVTFFTSYRVFDKWKMFHTAYLVWAVFLACGGVWLAARFAGKWVHAALGALALAQIGVNWNTAGRFGDNFVQAQTLHLMAQLPPDATLIGPWTTLRPIEYYQIVHDQRRDLTLVDVTLLSLGKRDLLGTADVAQIDDAVDAELRQAVACANGEVYVVNPALLGGLGRTVRIETELYRVLQPNGAEPADCKRS